MQAEEKGKEMAFCANCGKELILGSSFCTHCGAPVPQEALGKTEGIASIPNSNSVPQSSDGFAQAVKHGASAGSGLSWASFKIDSDVLKPVASQVEAEGIGRRDGTVPPNALLANWEIDWGMLLLGVFTVPLINVVLIVLFDGMTIPIPLFAVYIILFLINVIFQIVYSLRFYHSYFSEKPLLNEVKLVSYLNGFGGGLIGLLWSYNMILRKKGVSYIVAAVLFAIEFINIVMWLVELFLL